MNNLLEKITVCDMGNDSIVDKAYCKFMVPAVNTILEENPETTIPVPSPGTTGSPSQGKTRDENVPECLKSSRVHKQDSNNGSTNSDDNITVSHCGIMYDSGKQVFPSDETVFHENCTTEIFPNSKTSVGFSEVDTNKINKRKVRNHLDFSSSKLEDISSEPVNPVSLPYVVDATLSLFLKDQIPSEVSNFATQRLNFSLSSVEGVTVLHEKERVSEDNVVGGNNGNDNEKGASLVPERIKFRAIQPNFTPFQAEFSDAIVVTTSCAKVSLVICDNQEHQKEEVARSSMSFLSVAQSMLYPEDSSELLDDNLVGGSFNSMSGVRENVSSECSELQHPGIGSRLILEDMVKQNVQLACFSMLEAQKQENAALIVPTNNTQNDILDIGNFKGEKIDIQIGEERFFSPIETPQCKSVSEHQLGEFVRRSSSADMRCNDLTLKDDIPLEKKCPSSPTEGDGVTTTSNKSDELVGAVPDVQSDMHSPGTAIEETASGNSSGDGKNLDSKSMVEHGSDLTASTSSTHHIAKNMNSGVRNNPIMEKMLPQSLQVSSKVSTVGLNSSCSELNGGKSQQCCVTSRTHSSRVFSASKASTSSTHISMLRTWHRTVSNSPASLLTSKPSVGTLPPKRSIPIKKGNLQNTSYIRRGNSLVRKPTTTAVLPQVSPVNQLPSSGLDESQKIGRYVRFGNGSQHIRDPKKRTRILANEKIRWSLHRQRLARKKQYCQFFTKFGKCNKDGGNCPYIHDPLKIAVCTRFLNGLCSTPNCKLTHKVIPERMPDCSYFLQGLCTNRNCPYRHVNVNPKASICEQFLRGYCADGNECRKKHSYVCPTFEATGTFAPGNKCKLHHPKKPRKGKKMKRSEDRNSKGRYFGIIPIDLSEPGMMVAPPRQCQNDSLEGIGQAYKQAKSNDGGSSDYISLDVIEEELAESIGQAYKRAKFCDSDPVYLHLDNLDELIEPVRIMKDNFAAQSHPHSDSPQVSQMAGDSRESR